ncbi:MAG TPA: thiamine pyrophosphate-dependent enzyme, partial [Candidatus Latescibacteria bacterium]|nr:thiamine pyrophosphate-dependent enzyme [Candidatus Latescibacterota bacterium]
MLRMILTIRMFEEKMLEFLNTGVIKGGSHLYIGQEAVATGVCAALRKDDYITSTHRGHGHGLAKGGDPKALMAEILGKATGVCRGRGGSLHLADLNTGNLGANGIVGGSLGIAAGA